MALIQPLHFQAVSQEEILNQAYPMLSLQSRQVSGTWYELHSTLSSLYVYLTWFRHLVW